MLVPSDIAAHTHRRRASFSDLITISAIGDLHGAVGLAEYDASDFIVVQRLGTLKVGELAELLFYRKTRTADWIAPELEKQFPPDATFSGGKWIKGEGIVPKKR